MANSQSDRFKCPNCGAEYKLVRAETPAVDVVREVTCKSCGGPSRHGKELSIEVFSCRPPRRASALIRPAPSRNDLYAGMGAGRIIGLLVCWHPQQSRSPGSATPARRLGEPAFAFAGTIPEKVGPPIGALQEKMAYERSTGWVPSLRGWIADVLGRKKRIPPRCHQLRGVVDPRSAKTPFTSVDQGGPWC